MPPTRTDIPRLNFAELVTGLGAAPDGQPGADGPAAPLTDLTDDSRRVVPGACFVARDTGDGRWVRYVSVAVERGAAAVVAPGPVDVPAGVGLCVLPRVDQALAGRLAARFFGHPAERLKLVGVTGTNGKTTVATLTQYLLQAAGVKCGLIGTVSIDEGAPGGPTAAELTTPGAIDLHRHFAAMVASGCAACSMEVSSHALDQGRVDKLRFDVAVFTNLTQDHLDYHGTMDAYAAAKARLFSSLSPQSTAVLNADDPAALRMAGATDAGLVWTSVHPAPERGRECSSSSGGEKDSSPSFDAAGGGDGPAGDEPTLVIHPGRHEAALHLLAADVLEASAEGCRVRLHHGDAAADLALRLIGRHNVSNWLQAVAAAVAAGADWADAPAVFAAMPAVPGRLEPVRVPPPDALKGAAVPAVLVDYAHTPDALENVLNAVRPVTAGRLICVFGCGGDRDRTKRPKMARIACELADRAVLTSDNPRTEDPQRILDDAVAGVPPNHRDKVTVQIDRAAAIRDAIAAALPGDTVLIAGKGHEDYQIVGTVKHHFDDREHAAAALNARIDS